MKINITNTKNAKSELLIADIEALRLQNEYVYAESKFIFKKYRLELKEDQGKALDHLWQKHLAISAMIELKIKQLEQLADDKKGVELDIDLALLMFNLN